MCFTVGQTPFLKILYSIAYGSREENVNIYFLNLLTQQYFYNNPFWLPSIVDIGFTYSTVVQSIIKSPPVRVETVVGESLTMTHDVDLRPVPSLTQDATEGGHLSANTCEGRRLKKPSPASLGLVSSLTPSPDIAYSSLRAIDLHISAQRHFTAPSIYKTVLTLWSRTCTRKN